MEAMAISSAFPTGGLPFPFPPPNLFQHEVIPTDDYDHLTSRSQWGMLLFPFSFSQWGPFP